MLPLDVYQKLSLFLGQNNQFLKEFDCAI